MKCTIELLPIKISSPEQQKEICDLLDIIIDRKNQTPLSATTDLENQIDQLAYQLYELTEEELKL